MGRKRWVPRVLSCLLIGLGVVTIGNAADPADPVSAQATGLGAGGEFHPLPPARIFESGPGSPINDVNPAGKKPTTPAGSDFTVRVAGRGGLPDDPNEILAVVMNVTVAQPTVGGWLAVRPADQPFTPGSLVNFAAGRNVPNMTVVGLSDQGDVTVRLRTDPVGRAHVLIDVFGWISSSSYDGAGADDGARLIPVGPGRLLDSREPGSRPWGDGESRAVRIRGAQTVPGFSPSLTVPNRPTISAALLNLTVVNNARSGNTSTYIAAADRPLSPPVPTSNTNVVRGQIKANLAWVPIGPDGNIHIYNHDGVTDVIVDVVGYFEDVDDDSTLGRIVPLEAPFRSLDTREPAFGSVPLGFGSIEDWSFEEFAESVSIPGSALDLSAQSGLLGNLTATDVRRLYPTRPVSSTFLTLFPGDTAQRPSTSNLNLGEAEVVPNMALLRFGSSGGDDYVVSTYNHDGSVHYLFDVFAVVLK